MKLSGRRFKTSMMKLFSCNSQWISGTHCHRLLDLPNVKQGSKTGEAHPPKSILTKTIKHKDVTSNPGSS